MSLSRVKHIVLAVATADVRKELNFCRKTAIPVLGVVENMSGFVCPCCGERTNIFMSGGGEVMATDFGVPFLGRVPIDPVFVELIESGRRPRYEAPTGPSGNSGGSQDRTPGTAGQAATLGATDVGATSADAKEHETLVEKYPDCSLAPTFKRITADVVAAIRAGG
ncbi:cytosolic Fe-S cluster assembly factor CFD1 [Magnaporthiopsis poae ATCC 64411]|uniref:Cytosolic Fe-S cluster assembly factor CFD1 n=1 Tax=Magnaporthiopsis poae (strain ATCC 64411 / 73-15) TaxID=644358 RepID=A0A0C4EAY6_MAGP6|nr:cytosolic Fe-S cluster assembly factor CFD1 [Magnaporthiopsis poae ATCC 64411]